MYTATGRLFVIQQPWEAVTDDQGYYRFTDVPPGTYVVEVEDPAGYLPTTSARVDVSAGANVTVNVDFGFYALPRFGYLPVVLR